MILPEPNALSKGHCVIIPLRHVSSFFDITDKERKSLMSLLELARNELQLRHQPSGFHIGFNDGEIFFFSENVFMANCLFSWKNHQTTKFTNNHS